MERESDGDTNCSRSAQYNHQMIDNGTEGLGNKRTSVDYPNDCIIKIGQNTKKSLGNLRRLTLTEWKTIS